MDQTKQYKAVIANMELEIISQYGSIMKFSNETGISRFNLSRVFRGHTEMSIFLFMRIAKHLKLTEKEAPQRTTNLNLREFLQLPHQEINNCVNQFILL